MTKIEIYMYENPKIGENRDREEDKEKRRVKTDMGTYMYVREREESKQ